MSADFVYDFDPEKCSADIFNASYTFLAMEFDEFEKFLKSNNPKIEHLNNSDVLKGMNELYQFFEKNFEIKMNEFRNDFLKLCCFDSPVLKMHNMELKSDIEEKEKETDEKLKSLYLQLSNAKKSKIRLSRKLFALKKNEIDESKLDQIKSLYSISAELAKSESLIAIEHNLSVLESNIFNGENILNDKEGSNKNMNDGFIFDSNSVFSSSNMKDVNSFINLLTNHHS